MHESVNMICGEVQNHNTDILLHNYFYPLAFLPSDPTVIDLYENTNYILYNSNSGNKKLL
jgi:hypothetical protein